MTFDEICCCSSEDFQHDLVKSQRKRISAIRFFLSFLLIREKQKKKKGLIESYFVLPSLTFIESNENRFKRSILKRKKVEELVNSDY